MLGLIGKKLGQTQVYDAQGNVRPVTIVLAGPNRVIQCKTIETDGYKAVQLGFDDQKESRVSKPLNGHFKKHQAAAVRSRTPPPARRAGSVSASACRTASGGKSGSSPRSRIASAARAARSTTGGPPA